MGDVIGAIILGIVAIVCFVFSGLQFKEKGFLFNNAYVYASKEEKLWIKSRIIGSLELFFNDRDNFYNQCG